MPNLTAEQQAVVRGVVKSIKDNQVVSMGGLAGTGKSTCMKVLSEFWPDFAVCAYTGKAANVLRKKGLVSASTIHSLIYKPMPNNKGGIEFVLKTKDEIPCQGFLVDEASMVSKEINDDLLSFDLPIVYVGDHGQLEPVGSKINLMADPMFRLETIHRNAGEIAWFANHLRQGKSPRTFHVKEKVVFVEPRRVTDEMMVGTEQMICAFNRSRADKNRRVRALAGREALIEVGERVMCLRNNRKDGLFNGMQGVVKSIKKFKMSFDSDGILFTDIKFDPNQFGKETNQFEFGQDTPNPFDYAYCITAHKSQGDEWADVMVFEQECDKWDHRRWIYTAASRAKESLKWVCPNRLVPAWL